VVASKYTREEARSQLGLAQDRRTIAILPGSRRKEIMHLLPDLLRAAGIIRERFPDVQFALPVAPTLERSFVKRFVDESGVPVTVIDGRVYDVLRASDAAMVTSGTATLETGLMAIPMVIAYRASRLTYWIGRLLVSVKNFGLVNIVAGRTVVPELLQDEATPDRIAEELGTILADPETHRRITEELVRVRTVLGEGGASRRAAAVVRELLTKAA